MFFVHNFAFVHKYTSDELQYDDFYETIKLIVGQLGSCQMQLQVKPVFKAQQDRFDGILKVIDHPSLLAQQIILLLFVEFGKLDLLS